MTVSDSGSESASGGKLSLLVIGDLHLRPTGERFPFDDLPVEQHDAVISLGDVIDENQDHADSVEAGRPYERLGREFFEHLNEHSIPVLAVPGNHDPVTCTSRLTEGLENVEVLHQECSTVPRTGTGYSVVGWGCEQFDFMSAILPPDYPDIPVNTKAMDLSDAVAENVLEASGRYIAGVDSKQDIIDHLNVRKENEFEESAELLENRFNKLVEVIQDAEDPVLVASHVSPFNVPFDIQEIENSEYHFGSVALRLAIAQMSPVGCLSGHTHQQGLSVVETTDGHSYVYNPGSPGVASIEINESDFIRTEEKI